MKKILLTLGLIIFTNTLWAQETLQSVTSRGDTTNNYIGFLNGMYLKNWEFTIDGVSMGYRDPLKVYGNWDGAAAVLKDGALRFDRSNDIFEENGSALAFVYPPSGIPYIRRYGTDFTILKIWSPRDSDQAYESTLALVNGDNEEEYLDLYNMNYPSNTSFGIRLQKRGTGNYKKFHFEYSDGYELYKVLSLAPDTTAVFHGHVGINTEANEYNLAVEGSVLAESIDVKLESNWPDYVFEDSYQNRDLFDLEDYINRNGKLPEVPSAEEVNENGINLGEMDALLLKKVEEITLHLIEQEKKIAELQKENKQLRELLENKK